MEKGLAYKVEAFYNNYCVRLNNDKIIFVTNGELFDQLEKIKLNYNLYKFIDKDVKISDELTADYYNIF